MVTDRRDRHKPDAGRRERRERPDGEPPRPGEDSAAGAAGVLFITNDDRLNRKIIPPSSSSVRSAARFCDRFRTLRSAVPAL